MFALIFKRSYVNLYDSDQCHCKLSLKCIRTYMVVTHHMQSVYKNLHILYYTVGVGMYDVVLQTLQFVREEN